MTLEGWNKMENITTNSSVYVSVGWIPCWSIQWPDTKACNICRNVSSDELESKASEKLKNSDSFFQTDRMVGMVASIIITIWKSISTTIIILANVVMSGRPVKPSMKSSESRAKSRSDKKPWQLPSGSFSLKMRPPWRLTSDPRLFYPVRSRRTANLAW